jgi:hypothetical protein
MNDRKLRHNDECRDEQNVPFSTDKTGFSSPCVALMQAWKDIVCRFAFACWKAS